MAQWQRIHLQCRSAQTHSILGLEDPLEEGVAACLENPMDRGDWQAIVLGVSKESDMTDS